MKIQCYRQLWRAVSLSVISVVVSACALTDPDNITPDATTADSLNVRQAQRDESLPIVQLLASTSQAGTATDQTIPTQDSAEEVLPQTRTVRWGGTIARIENQADQKTLLEIVSRPVKSNGRPIHNDRSFGRFVALVDTFLDPEIVSVDRDITVVGILAGKAPGKVGQSDYMFPVVDVDTFTYWKKSQKSSVAHFPHWNSRPYWYSDPFWRAWYLRQHGHRER